MEDTFQFIIESPQHNTGHKKRPRLVTSCDNCRLKKIKCLQPSPETKCEACKAAKIPCRFKDRERYFAERSRAIAGPNTPNAYALDQRTNSRGSLDAFSSSGSSSPSLSSISNPRSSTHSPEEPSGLVAPDYSPYGPKDFQGSSYSRHSSMSGYHSRNSSMGYNNIVGPGSADILRQIHNTYPQQPMDARFSLFDPEDHRRPHRSLMQQLIQSFFHHHASDYPFMNYEDTFTRCWELSPALCNSIAAIAVKYCDISRLGGWNAQDAAKAYAANARSLLDSVPLIPSTDTLHALILLCWSEDHGERFQHLEMANKMVRTLSTHIQPHLEMQALERLSMLQMRFPPQYQTR